MDYEIYRIDENLPCVLTGRGAEKGLICARCGGRLVSGEKFRFVERENSFVDRIEHEFCIREANREKTVIYRGQRLPTGAVEVTRSERVDGEIVETGRLPLRKDVRNHSPDGFEWGYCGSGPAQLALALFADVFASPADAREYYQFFKDAVVARLCGDWQMTDREISRFVYSVRHRFVEVWK